MKNFEIGSKALRRMIDNAADNCIAREQRLRDAFAEANKDSDASVILERDAMMCDVKMGIYNKDVATKFRKTFLERGGSEEPMVLYEMFKGSQPDPKAMLRARGLID